jgi:hypothetical protein
MNGTGSEPPENAQDTHERLRPRLFKAPPENFDPVKASDRELLVYGYPGRPESQRHPERYEHWKRMVSRPMLIIDPQFTVMPGKRLSGARARADFADAAPVGGQIPMAGCIQGVSSPDATAICVSGQWTVPDVVVPDSSKDLFACTTWLGNGTLRVGTWQEISLGAGRSTFPFYWHPWTPGVAVVKITTVPVSPGDVMYAVTWFYSSTEATIYLTNLNTGVYARFPIDVAGLTDEFGNPANLSLDAAWWALEAPPSGPSAPQNDVGGGLLPRYGDIYFDNCAATFTGDLTVDAGGGFFFPMLDINNQEISIAQAETDLLFRIQYTASGAG